MKRVFSNGGGKDFVMIPFEKLLSQASRVHLAAPYFTSVSAIEKAAQAGKSIQLLIGLNSATNPMAVEAAYRLPNVAVRYLTHRFHAKIFLFDDAAILGSANLTDGGLISNREGVFCFDRDGDLEAVEEIRALFLDLWESAAVLTDTKMHQFRSAWQAARPTGSTPDEIIENAVGRVEPRNVAVSSQQKSKERLFIDDLQRQVNEEYKPAFQEVGNILKQKGFLRPEFADVGLVHQTNRFLNWVRLTYVIGDDAWRAVLPQAADVRESEIIKYGAEWRVTTDDKVPSDYFDWLNTVEAKFGTKAALETATRDDITQGLLCLHAFTEQQRYVKGGLKNLPDVFWSSNDNDLAKARNTLGHLIHGDGDFVHRLHDVLYAPRVKLNYFGFFCALELFGSIHPEQCPPMTGRMAKALRFLGFDVRAA